ncbi:MAG TPA: hypothetical protein VGM90_36720 [Kofleriaceae bacterium]|jgi:rubredoxin
MWFLFHRNAKTRTVRDGESFAQECPECKATARFVEVEIEENVGVWFVDVVGDTSRAFKCTGCGNVFDGKDKPTALSRSSAPSRGGSSTVARCGMREQYSRGFWRPLMNCLARQTLYWV